MPNSKRIHSDKLKGLKRAATGCTPITGFLKKHHVDNDLIEIPNIQHPVAGETDGPLKVLSLPETNKISCNSPSPVTSTAEENKLPGVSQSEPKTYRGYQLTKDEILKQFDWIVVTRPHKLREHGYCNICNRFLQESIAKSGNGRLPIALKPGIELRYLERFVDHNFSKSHLAAYDCQLFEDSISGSNEEVHPWRRVIQKIHRTTRETLIHMAVAAYNDMKVGTLSANSWPSRHLSFLHSSSQIARMHNNSDNLTTFERFSATNQQLHYVTPVYYAEMCEFIGLSEKQKLQKLLLECTSLGIQVDGSQDRMTLDVKYVIARICLQNDIKTIFLGIWEPNDKGAAGLLEATKSVFENVGVPLQTIQNKVTSITTDGKAANTGEYNGLWAILQTKLGKSLITVWCSCHRADLVLGKMESMVPEVKWWRAELLNIASHFRGAKSRWKDLRAEALAMAQSEDHDSFEDQADYDEMIQNSESDSCTSKSYLAMQLRRFPQYFEVRMAEHTLRLVTAFLGNLKYCKKYFKKKAKEGTSKEKTEASGYLKKLNDDYFVHFSCVVSDILDIFKILQKSLQLEKLLIIEVKSLRDRALLKIRNMKTEPYPNGAEEEFVKEKGFPKEVANKKFPGYVDSRRSTNKFVPFKRCFKAVRSEVLLSAENYLESQLEDDKILKQLQFVGEAKTANSLLSALEPFYSEYKIADKSSLYDEAIGLEVSKLLPLSGSYNFCVENPQKFPQFLKIYHAILCSSPHSMVVERVVSMYNKIKSSGRCSLTLTAILNYLLVCNNGVGTAYFDPLPVIASFLESKERRNKLPNVQIYEEKRDYVQKFYQE